MSLYKLIAEGFLNAMFPKKCVGCGEIIKTEESLCDYCQELISKTNFDNRCKICGCIKKECQCKYRVFHFTSVTAPFYNEGVARNIMYAFKFRKKLQFADFLANRMAISVRTDFYGVNFNALVYVPLPLKSELKRGYNQSRELALRLSEILNIPFTENALGCKGKLHTQHKTKMKDRFNNVKGVYFPNISLSGRTVLLVDDIKTTGATLDECTKALLKAGANEVYCVTGLITKRQNKKKVG